MAQQLAIIDDLYDALQLKRQLDVARADGAEPSPQLVEDLDSYIEILSQHGVGVHDALVFEPVEGVAEYNQVCIVHWDSPSDLWRSVGRNINRDGIFLQTDDFPGIDAQLGIRVVLREPEVAFTLPAKVIWVNPQARTGRPQGMGVKFLWPSLDQRALFRRFLEGQIDPTELEGLG